jgi:acetylornithine deacetylase
MEQLIAVPSVSCVSPQWDQSNGPLVDLLGDWLETLGFRVERLPIPDHAGKYNLIATLGQGPGGLVLAGHTDTVPFDQARWRSDPFRLTERDGRLYGLGTSDMKAFFALVLEDVGSMDLRRLRRPLVILATADEESSMSGAQALVRAERRLGRHALIGEPTGLRPVRMHKGVCMEAIRLTGRAGHSSDPALGVNALDGMYLVLGEVLRWRDELQARFHNPLFRVPVPTLNLGRIEGGDNPNRICGHCELQIDLRPLPGMDIASLRAELRERLEQRLAGRGLGLELAPLFDGVPPMETPTEAEIVRAAEALAGHAAESVAFGTEGPYFNQLGMETLILGPGDIDQAHQPDEFLALERIPPYLDLIRSLIGRFCLGDGEAGHV